MIFPFKLDGHTIEHRPDSKRPFACIFGYIGSILADQFLLYLARPDERVFRVYVILNDFGHTPCDKVSAEVSDHGFMDVILHRLATDHSFSNAHKHVFRDAHGPAILSKSIGRMTILST